MYSTLHTYVLYNQNDSNCIKNIKQKSPQSALGQPLPTDLQETVGIYSKFKYELKLLKAKHDKIMLSTAN